MMPVMQGKRQTIDSYMTALPEGVDAVFAALREAILAVAPEADETIKYGMAS